MANKIEIYLMWRLKLNSVQDSINFDKGKIPFVFFCEFEFLKILNNRQVL